MNERDLRKILASNLGLIEPNLRLVAEEYSLENTLGTKGYIDILARDALNQYVIIEIKRAKQPSRQALHEISKYIALLRTKLGLSQSNIRCLIVAVDWSELLVPFSEFRRISPYHVDGYKVSTEIDRIAVEVVQPAEEPIELSISRSHMIYLSESKEGLENTFHALLAKLQSGPIPDFALFIFEHDGSNKNVIYPHAIYAVVRAPASDRERDLIRNLPASSGYEEELEEDNPLYLEEHIWTWVNDDLVGLPDDMEIGYPEKFGTILSRWIVKEVVTQGRFIALEKAEGIERLKIGVAGIEGDNAFLYLKTTNTRFPNHFKEALERMTYSLSGNSEWSEIALARLLEAQAVSQNVQCSIAIYNPASVLFTIFHTIKDGTLSYIPTLEMTFDEGDPKQNKLCFGLLEWDKKKVLDNVERIVNSVYEGEDALMTIHHFGQDYEFEDRAVNALGMKYSIFEVSFSIANTPTIVRLESVNGTLSRRAVDTNTINTIVEFITENQVFARSIRDYFGGFYFSPGS